jgi:cholesterol oxidase
VGVGGGSLVYANALPVPKPEFFQAKSWAHLADWQTELQSYYKTALKMLGATDNPRLEVGDLALKKLSEEMQIEDQFEPTNVGVFLGEPGETVDDPYFSGDGPDRTGCIFCGACMTGCRFNAKNSLDKNYLYLAKKRGAKIIAETEVFDVIPLGSQDGSKGYRVKWKSSTRFVRKKGEVIGKAIVFAGGVLGTVPLLLKLKQSSLPLLSAKTGMDIRTNSESLVGITTFDKNISFSDGVAIGSILHTDQFSHLEPVRYGSGSGFWRILMSPMVHGRNVLIRLINSTGNILAHPIKNLRILMVWNWAKKTQILLFMRTLDSTLRFSLGWFGIKSSMVKGERPTPFVPEAKSLSEKYAKFVNGKPIVLLTETLFGIPTTAHILGGAVMGRDKEEGVIDKNNQVFDYKNMYICDGSAISANPGVNPSLTITALSERAMSKIPSKQELEEHHQGKSIKSESFIK